MYITREQEIKKKNNPAQMTPAVHTSHTQSAQYVDFANDHVLLNIRLPAVLTRLTPLASYAV